VPEQHVSADPVQEPVFVGSQFDLLGTAPGYVEQQASVSELSNDLAVAEAVSEPVFDSQVAASQSFVTSEQASFDVANAAVENEVDAVVEATFDGNAQTFVAQGDNVEFVGEPAFEPTIEVSSSQDFSSEGSFSSEGNAATEQGVPAIEVSSSSFENDDLFADLPSTQVAAVATQQAVPATSRSVRVPAPTGFNGTSPAWYMVMNRYYDALRKAQQNSETNLDSQQAFTNVTGEPNQ
jgi:hypothetical protein